MRSAISPIVLHARVVLHAVSVTLGISSIKIIKHVIKQPAISLAVLYALILLVLVA